MLVDDLYVAVGPVLAYADALDRCDWGLLASVFSPDVRAQYGDELHLRGRAKVIHMIRAVLDPCGPTQHLLGNFKIRDNNVSCYVRAYHASKETTSDKFYELFGRYHAEIRTEAGYSCISAMREEVMYERGTYAVLGEYPTNEASAAPGDALDTN